MLLEKYIKPIGKNQFQIDKLFTRIYTLMKESNTDMNIDAEQFKKLNAFLTYFFPFLDMDQKELNKNNADLLIRYVVLLIDALLKGENLYKKRHMILPDGKVLCSSDTTELMSNITL